MTSSSSPSRPAIASQTLFRGLRILDVVAQGKRSMPEIAAATGLAFSTAHRLASALVQERYLSFEPRKGYRLGSKLMELGFAAYRESDLTQVARASLEELARLTEDTVHLAVLEAEQVVYLDKIGGKRSIEISSRIGGRKPVCTTGVGKALILDQGPDSWRAHFLREHGGTPQESQMDSWMLSMNQYSRDGHAFDLGEDAPQIRCVAAPVYAAGGGILAAISVSSTVDYTDEARLVELAPVVQATAAKISRQFGAQVG